MEEDDENLFLTLEIHRMLVKISLLKKKVIWETVECYFAKIYGLVIRIFYGAQEDTMCKETSEVSEGRQEPFEKITNTTFLLNKDFLVI